MAQFDIDDARDADTEAGGDSLRETPAGISDEHQVDYDTEVIDEVKVYPEVMVVFDHIARISIQDYGYDGNILADEQNLEGAGQYGYDVELTVANPHISFGELWKETDAQYPSYTLCGDPESEANPYELNESIIKDDDGNPTDVEVEGISQLPGGQTFDAQRIDPDCDYMTITVSGSRGTDVLGVLDTAGRWFMDQDGNVTEGLFETPPSFGTDSYSPDDDPAPRLTGYPELRADMDGQMGAIHCTFAVDDPTEADTRSPKDISILRADGDELTALAPPTPGDDHYHKPTYPRVNNTFWTDVDDTETANGTASPDSDSDAIASAKEAISGDDSDETEASMTYDDLSDDGQQFVDAAVEAMTDVGYDSVASFSDPDFGTRVEDEQSKSNMEANEATLAAIIDDKLPTEVQA
jgi:hypothetical protein